MTRLMRQNKHLPASIPSISCLTRTRTRISRHCPLILRSSLPETTSKRQFQCQTVNRPCTLPRSSGTLCKFRRQVTLGPPSSTRWATCLSEIQCSNPRQVRPSATTPTRMRRSSNRRTVTRPHGRMARTLPHYSHIISLLNLEICRPLSAQSTLAYRVDRPGGCQVAPLPLARDHWP